MTYTQQEINNQLIMKSGTSHISFRHDLLNRNDIKIGTLDGISSAKISYGSLRKGVKGTANYSLDTYLQKNIDYKNHRIQSWYILHMPDGGTIEWSQGIYRLPVAPDKIEGLKISKEISAFDKSMRLEL